MVARQPKREPRNADKIVRMGTEPLRVYAGETISWARVSDYPLDIYTAVYRLRNSQHVLPPITCDADGAHSFLASVSAATSSKWPTGRYHWTLVAEATIEGTSVVHVVDRGEIEVIAITGAMPGDDRTHAQKMVTLLEQQLLKAAERDSDSVSLGTPGGSSRSKSYKTEADLRRELAHWRGVVRSEREAAGRAKGEISTRIQTPRFR